MIRKKTFWESDDDDAHWIVLKLPRPMSSLNAFEIYQNSKYPSDTLPRIVEIFAGSSSTFTSVGRTVLPDSSGWYALCEPFHRRFSILKICIHELHRSGTSCRISKLRLWLEPNQYILPEGRQEWDPVPFEVNPRGKRSDKDTSTLEEGNTGDPDYVTNSALKTGMIIHDRYVLDHQIGRGGFGSTWSATAIRRRNQIVVLKFIHREMDHEIDMLRQEADKLLSLKHPRIPVFIEILEYPFVLVMEWIPGLNLAQIVHKHGPWQAQETFIMIKEMIHILNDVHSKHIVHRDIKPANVMRHETQNTLFLIDFGVSVSLEPGADRGCTNIGTDGFRAPEIQRQLGCRFESDFFSLGATAVYMLTGKNITSMTSYPEEVRKLQQSGRIDVVMANLLRRLLSENPMERRQQAAEILGLQGLPTLIPPVYPGQLTSTPPILRSATPYPYAAQSSFHPMQVPPPQIQRFPAIFMPPYSAPAAIYGPTRTLPPGFVPVHQWTTSDVALWLNGFAPQLSQVFMTNQVTGMHLLNSNEQTFYRMGLDSEIVRLLLLEISRLRQPQS
eukprot:c5855_g1_i1.p1 GENE.c5855_g1_i1~~c5855_g1_i1.p1  ORF type:complete len:557 (-),score=80.84 c5855_g1_i1:6-1676(-)